MESPDPHAVPAVPPRTADPDEAIAVRDAQRIAERIGQDEAAADEARQRYRSELLPSLPPDERVRPWLREGEVVHATREHALLEGTPDSGEPTRDGGLYLTNQRLLHVDGRPHPGQWALEDFEEMVAALERLLLVRLRDGSDLVLETDSPRRLRVEVATAVRTARSTAAG
jgi:hypothetical protein